MVRFRCPVIPEWQDRAVCAVTPDANAIWFHKTGNYREARRLCNGCPVRMACLEWELAIEASAPSVLIPGMFGGKSPRERSKILKQRRLAA